MSHQHIRAWQDLLQRLSALKDNVHDSTGWLRHRELSKAALTSVEGLPAVMPHAVLKKLVQQAQVGELLRNQVPAVSLLCNALCNVIINNPIWMRTVRSGASSSR